MEYLFLWTVTKRRGSKRREPVHILSIPDSMFLSGHESMHGSTNCVFPANIGFISCILKISD